MSQNIRAFYQTLFNDSEGVCWTADIKGTGVTLFSTHAETDIAFPKIYNFLCINPLQLYRDNRPTQPWHSEFIGRRADCNVTAYRNILVEFDGIDLHAQIDLVHDLKLPYSTAVYSGGKSMHYIISLDTPFATEREYRRHVKAIYAKLGAAVDDKCLNPSRLSRAPGAMRGDKEQKLIRVNRRITMCELLEWLGPLPPERDVHVESIAVGYKRVLGPFTGSYLRWGAQPGERNQKLFMAACEMCRAGYSRYEVFDKVYAVADLPDNEIRNCIDSAFTRAMADAPIEA